VPPARRGRLRAHPGGRRPCSRHRRPGLDPAILGTHFEPGLDPCKRSQLGAHYTDRDKIMKIVGPVVVDPLLAEWDGVRAQIAAALSREKAAKSPAAATRSHNEVLAQRTTFLKRLRAFRVLDPACGSGKKTTMKAMIPATPARRFLMPKPTLRPPGISRGRP
jgi:hypothetical protein